MKICYNAYFTSVDSFIDRDLELSFPAKRGYALNLSTNAVLALNLEKPQLYLFSMSGLST